MPPIYQEAPPSGPSRYLREADRIHIADRLREKATVRATPPNWAAARPPSAARYAATDTPAMAGTGRTPPRSAPIPAGPAPRGKIGQNPELRDFKQDDLTDGHDQRPACGG